VPAGEINISGTTTPTIARRAAPESSTSQVVQVAMHTPISLRNVSKGVRDIFRIHLRCNRRLRPKARVTKNGFSNLHGCSAEDFVRQRPTFTLP
jgi:hypothetical protein